MQADVVPGRVAKGVGRAFVGGLIFAVPALMTTEMWRMAVVIPRTRLGLLLVATVVLAVGLVHHFGFLRGTNIGAVRAVVDTGIALVVGLVTAGVVLTVLSVAQPLRSWEDAVTIVVIGAVPAMLGASFARSQLGEGSARGRERQAYRQELLVMTAGAAVLASSIAPTEEVVLLATKMSSVDGLLLAVFTVAVMHAVVYGVELKGGYDAPGGFWPAFLVFSVAGYVVALVVSAYLLWTFGRYAGAGLQASALQAVVLGLPAGLGAAAAKVIL